MGKAVLVILCGLVFRWIATYFATFGDKFNRKERLFMAFAWMPKATVQAAIGGVVLDTVFATFFKNIEDRFEYTEYGTIMLTVAVLAIVITAPLGAILINTLGVKWLSYDGDSSGDPACTA